MRDKKGGSVKCHPPKTFAVIAWMPVDDIAGFLPLANYVGVPCVTPTYGLSGM